MRSIELLAPARNLECGIEAIRHGADAVYIGAPRFGARAVAGNSVDDIATLVQFAHPFGTRIYVTVNTLLYDDELPVVDRLIDDLARIEVDALIVQDPRLLSLNRGRLPLHASTQMDNRTIDDVRARLEEGYEQTVLARELSLDETRAIHEAVPTMALEAFVHGALCVSYSGRCYASEYCFGRSANRGECAQFCRLPFDLVDAEGHIIKDSRTHTELRQKHLLSLRDMNRAADVEAMMDAGVSSFKIEGRLKDVAYVKNTTAYYRLLIDEIISRRSTEYSRASVGHIDLSFTPNLQKSFNRRFTDYFLHGRTADIACFATPKAIGEPVGSVKEVFSTAFSVAGTTTFSNGDGLCFLDAEGRLKGFRVNSVDPHGRLYPADTSILSVLRKGMLLYRNVDAAFERLLARPTADRRIAVRWLLEDTSDGFSLTLTTEDGRVVSRSFDYPHELARSPQDAQLCRQLMRLGDTIFSTTEADITIRLSDNWFIPASVLGGWRREVIERLTPLHPLFQRGGAFSGTLNKSKVLSSSPLFEREGMGVSLRGSGASSSPLMTCRYCLRHAIGYCTRDGHRLSGREPLSLRLSDGRTFPLHFDCQRCEMQVLRPK